MGLAIRLTLFGSRFFFWLSVVSEYLDGCGFWMVFLAGAGIGAHLLPRSMFISRVGGCLWDYGWIRAQGPQGCIWLSWACGFKGNHLMGYDNDSIVHVVSSSCSLFPRGLGR